MESFGKILKTVREEKQIDIEQIASETSISKEYLIALEEENLDVIPGSTYTAGFLRNYSDFLGCDTKYLLGLYRAKILQETPTPAELLQIGKGPMRIVLWCFVGLVILAGLVIGGIFLYRHLDAKSKEGVTTVNMARVENRTYTLAYDPISVRVYDGDTLRIPFTSGNVDVLVSSTNDELRLETPIGIQVVDLGEELNLDIDGNGIADVSLFLADISKAEADRGAEIRMFLKPEAAANITVAVDESSIPLESTLDTASQIVIFEGTRAYPFTLLSTFRGACIFRYQSDKKELIEDYFTTGDTLTCTSNNSLRIWMSNANAVKMQIQGDGSTVSIDIGKPGQVLVQDIRWIRDSQGTYKLVVLEVE